MAYVAAEGRVDDPTYEASRSALTDRTLSRYRAFGSTRGRLSWVRRMPTRRKLYIDSEGVERGYYVYVHKDCTTGEVFYVGKGSGRRAWDIDRRHIEWKKKVASLTNGWDVEIVKEDLSEIEAFDLEAELVEQYGGCAAEGGALTNRIPGGEEPLSVRLGIQFDDGGWSAAYYDARRFKEFSRAEEEELVRELTQGLDALISTLELIGEEAEDIENEKLSDDVADVECIVGSLRDSCSDFLRHRVSWKDVGLTLEETHDDLESAAEDPAEYDESVRSVLQRACRIVANALHAVDTGNRIEAEEMANQVAGKK